MGINEKQKYWSDARRIYKDHYGQNSIKTGYVLHHLDHNPANNDIINLAQMSRLDHSRLHNSRSSYSNIEPVKKGRIHQSKLLKVLRLPVLKKDNRTDNDDKSKIIWFDI